jgi:hypothetical protein
LVKSEAELSQYRVAVSAQYGQRLAKQHLERDNVFYFTQFLDSRCDRISRLRPGDYPRETEFWPVRAQRSQRPVAV